MKIFVTGARGQLGYDVMQELTRRGHEVIGSDIGAIAEEPFSGFSYLAMDITDERLVEETIDKVRPDAVIHCAAWTAVDAAEEEQNQAVVYAVNVTGTQNIANACKKRNIKMMYLSTDYVFDGKGELPWKPDCRDFAPLNVYGKTKLEGEIAVASTLEKYFVVRIAWVFGAHGTNFVKTMLAIGKKHKSLRVVDDQIGTPTYTADLARLLLDMIETEKYGYYHATNEGGYLSWYEFAKEIFRQAAEAGHTEYEEHNLEVLPVTTEAYGVSKAARPHNSRLDKQKLIEKGFKPLPDWRDALKRYLNEERISWDR